MGDDKKKSTFPLQIARGFATGAVTAVAITLFSLVVAKSTELNQNHRFLILTIPLAALLTTFLTKKVGNMFRHGTHEAINDINRKDDGVEDMAKQEARAIRPGMGIISAIACALTHISGASGGKDSAGVQVGFSCSSLVSWIEGRFHSIENDTDANSTYLMCGASAAFGALFSAPISGVLFGTQFASPKTTRLDVWLPCTISSFTSVLISRALGIHVLDIPEVIALDFNLKNAFLVIALAVLVGFSARFFCFFTEKANDLLHRHVKNDYLRALGPALVLLALTGVVYFTRGDFRYNGLGAELMYDIIGGNFHHYDAPLKFLFFILTVMASFFGGEVIPLLVIGSAMGASFASLVGLEISGTAVIGALAMLSGGTNLPLVCFALGLELFGFTEPVLLFLAASISFVASGKHGIYTSQEKPY